MYCTAIVFFHDSVAYNLLSIVLLAHPLFLACIFGVLLAGDLLSPHLMHFALYRSKYASEGNWCKEKGEHDIKIILPLEVIDFSKMVRILSQGINAKFG